MESLNWGRAEAAIRINGMDTSLWQEDLDAIVCKQLYLIRVPKTETAEQIQRIDAVLGYLEALLWFSSPKRQDRRLLGESVRDRECLGNRLRQSEDRHYGRRGGTGLPRPDAV